MKSNLRNLILFVVIVMYGVRGFGDTSVEWRGVWETFNKQYSYFFLKPTDWDEYWTRHQDDFNSISDAGLFAEKLNERLNTLMDWHVVVIKPDGEPLGFKQEVVPNYHPEFILPKYTSSENGGYEDLSQGNVILHGWVTPRIAHIIITTLGSQYDANINKNHLEVLRKRYQSADGWIIDLRLNAGGNELKAREFAGNLVTEESVYAYHRTRADSNNRTLLGQFSPRMIAPDSSATPFDGKVVTLVGQRTMSSAESFALMLRKIPGGTLVGDRTRGASGQPVFHRIESLGVQYSVSSWVAYDSNKQTFEGTGIQPDFFIPPDMSFNEDSDFVLEKGIEIIEAGLNQYGIPGEWIVGHDLNLPLSGDTDRDGVPDFREYFSGTDPRDADSVFTIRHHSGPDGRIHLTWDVTHGRHYQLLFAPSLDPHPDSLQIINQWLPEPNQSTLTTAIDPMHASGFYLVKVDLLNP